MKRKKRAHARGNVGRRPDPNDPPGVQSWDENFAYIAGYTEGGAAFGTTWDDYYMTQRETEGTCQLRSRNGAFVPAVDYEVARLMEKPPLRTSDGRRSACIVCGKTKQVKLIECCGSHVCVATTPFTPYSDPTLHCSRAHARYTVCGYHRDQNHVGLWTACALCKSDFEPELYLFYATNRFNAVTLDYVPSHNGRSSCVDCGTRVSLLADAFQITEGQIICGKCSDDRQEPMWIARPGSVSWEQGGPDPLPDGEESDGDDEIPF